MFYGLFSVYWDSSVSYVQGYAITPNVQLSWNHSPRFIHLRDGEETDSEQDARNFNYQRGKMSQAPWTGQEAPLML